MTNELTDEMINAVIGYAWADDISFDEIKRRTGLAEKDVIKLMRRELKPSSFRLWRKRVTGRKAKHRKRTKVLEREDRL